MLTCPNCRKRSLGITTASLAPGFHQTTKGMKTTPNRGRHRCTDVKRITNLNEHLHSLEFTSVPTTILAQIHYKPFNPTPQEAVLHHPGQLQNANVERLRLLQALNLDWPREIYCGADVNSVTQCEVRRQLEELFMRQRGDRRYNRSNFTPIWSELSLVPFLCHMDSLPGQISTGIDVIHVIPPLTIPMKNYRII